jgi:hypothetical protein
MWYNNKMSDNKKSKEELKEKLRSKLGMMKIKRSSNSTKNSILDKNFEKAGIDKEEFEKNLNDLKKNVDINKFFK